MSCHDHVPFRWRRSSWPMESEKTVSKEETRIAQISPEIAKVIMDLINSSIMKEGQNIMPFDNLSDYLRLFLPSESRISNFLNVRAKEYRIMYGSESQIVEKDLNESLSWVFEECKVCYQFQRLNRRLCCDFSVCNSCLRQYYASQVEIGSVKIECINIQCHVLIDPLEVSVNLDEKLANVYNRLLKENNCNQLSKTCPNCCSMHTIKSPQKLRSIKKAALKQPTATRVQCENCKFYWCFVCHSPWHQDLTCQQYRQGDKLLKLWAKQLSQGQLNAQRCPKCKTFIQKSGGCDHMHCNRCKTGFCYRCGEQLRHLKFFGDHYSKLSIFGCKYRFKKESPIQRKAIRGAVFASKLILMPIVGSLVVGAGAMFVSVALAFLPFYGGVTIYKRKLGPHQIESDSMTVIHQ